MENLAFAITLQRGNSSNNPLPGALIVQIGSLV